MTPSIEALLRRLKRTTYVYGDESGHLKTAAYFMLGILLTKDPDRHENQIHRFRQRLGYGRELKYSSTDRQKLPLAKKVVRYFLDEPDLTFRALAIDNSQYDLSEHTHFEDSFRPQDVAYNYRYRRLIERFTPKNDELVLILDDRRRAEQDNLPEYLQREVSNLKSLQLVDSSKHQLVQVADLLVGSVFGDATEVEQPVKREVISQLRSGLEVRHLMHETPRQRDDFIVDVWRPPRGGS